MSDDLELTSEDLDGMTLELPPSQRRLITSSADFSVETLVNMLRGDGLTIPNFQRQYVWSEKKASRLIESLVMQCPIPVIYLNRRVDEVLEVVDGNQRLTSLRDFLDGHLALSGLTAYTELNDLRFKELDQKYQRQIRNRTIRCAIIEPESNEQIKFDVFERLNSGSVALSPQELRHGLYSGRFTQVLTGLAKNKAFIELTGIRIDKRMKRDELVLRFFALSERLNAYQKPLSTFLTNFLKDHREDDARALELSSQKFNRMLQGLKALFGDAAFRFATREGSTKKFNTAYFDAVSVGYVLSDLYNAEAPDVDAAERLRLRFAELQESDEFRNATLRATSDAAAVKKRISMAKDIFNVVA